MKNEAEFCTVIKNSLVVGYKQPDPSGQYTNTSIRSCDGFGMIQNGNKLNFVCWEAKFLKKPGAFSFKRIEPHQNYYLTEWKKAESIRCFIIVGVDYGRADKRAFVFEWDNDFGELYKIGFSIHLKELNKLPYNKISKGKFTFDNIITYSMLKEIYPDFEEVCDGFRAKVESKNGESDI